MLSILRFYYNIESSLALGIAFSLSSGAHIVGFAAAMKEWLSDFASAPGYERLGHKIDALRSLSDEGRSVVSRVFTGVFAGGTVVVPSTRKSCSLGINIHGI